ncbi:MAG: type II secretion system protein GspN, partial [Spirochaetota bacterium]
MNNILTLLRTARNATGHFFSVLLNQKGIKRYLLLLAVSTVLFVVVLFPYDRLIHSIVHSTRIPGVRSLDFTGLDISPSGTAKAETLVIIDARNSIFQLSKPLLIFSPINLLLKNTLAARMQASELTYSDNARNIRGSLTVNTDIRMNRKSWMPESGILSATVKEALVSGIQIQGFAVPDIRFNTIQAELEYDENRLVITRLQFGGTDLKGQITGSIDIDPQSTRKSAYNVTVI